jgi:hypothetical protein
MFNVICPECKEIRTVAAKKVWMIGNQPYEKICKACCQKGKIKSEATRKKLSEAVMALQTEEVLQRKSEYMKAHPEHWQGKIRGKDSQHIHSEDTKQKIGESVKETIKNKKEGL